MHVCVCVCVCVHVCCAFVCVRACVLCVRVCVFACVYALRTVPMDKILCFINTLISLLLLCLESNSKHHFPAPSSLEEEYHKPVAVRVWS